METLPARFSEFSLASLPAISPYSWIFTRSSPLSAWQWKNVHRPKRLALRQSKWLTNSRIVNASPESGELEINWSRLKIDCISFKFSSTLFHALCFCSPFSCPRWFSSIFVGKLLVCLGAPLFLFDQSIRRLSFRPNALVLKALRFTGS